MAIWSVAGATLVIALVGSACDDHSVGDSNSNNNQNVNEVQRDAAPQPWCGDGQRDVAEECDGLDLGGESCDSVIGRGGVLGCGSACQFDLSECMPIDGCGNGLIDGAEECDDGNFVDWDGCTDCVITEFLVNTYRPERQMSPDVVVDASGGFLVVWQSYGQDGYEWEVFGQRFDPLGVPVGAEFHINTFITQWQLEPRAAMSPDGRFVVVWSSHFQDGSAWGIIGRRFAADGSPLGIEFQVNTYTQGMQHSPSVAMYDDGGFIVVWSSESQGGQVSGVYGQRFDSAGNPLSGEFNVSGIGDPLGSQLGDVVLFADGRFLVVYSGGELYPDAWGIFGRMFTRDASALGEEFQINTYNIGDQSLSRVDVTDDGRFVVVWTSAEQDGDDSGIFGQRFDSSGNPDGPEFQVNTHTGGMQLISQVAVHADGHFSVVWDSEGPDGNGQSVQIQHYDAGGSPLGPETTLNTWILDNQFGPSAAFTSSGELVVAWTSYGQDEDSYGVFAQRYDALGSPLGRGPWVTINRSGPCL